MGVRGGTKRGGFGGTQLTNVYQEVGSCANPSGKLASRGDLAGEFGELAGSTGTGGAFRNLRTPAPRITATTSSRDTPPLVPPTLFMPERR